MLKVNLLYGAANEAPVTKFVPINAFINRFRVRAAYTSTWSTQQQPPQLIEMASNPSATERTDASAPATTYTSGGLLHVSLTFTNDLVKLLSTLSSFDEELARISSEQRAADGK